jgi:CBS domain-containing protein
MSQKAFVTVNINDNPSALDVAKLMVKHRIGSVVVVEGNNNNKPISIILKGTS